MNSCSANINRPDVSAYRANEDTSSTGYASRRSSTTDNRYPNINNNPSSTHKFGDGYAERAEKEEQKKRRFGVVLYRVPEPDGDEDDKRFCAAVFAELKLDIKSEDIANLHRVGQKVPNRKRILIVRFKTLKHKQLFLETLPDKKGTWFEYIGFSDDLTALQREELNDRAIRRTLAATKPSETTLL